MRMVGATSGRPFWCEYLRIPTEPAVSRNDVLGGDAPRYNAQVNYIQLKKFAACGKIAVEDFSEESL